MKKLIGAAMIALLCLTLSACSSSSSKSAKESSVSKVKATNKTKKEANPEKAKWKFSGNTFSAGILTYKFTKSEVRDSVTDGKKVLVLYCNITNNTSKEQDPSNIFIVMHAYQKTTTADKSLMPGNVALDANGNDPLQKQTDALNDKLLGHKTTQAVIVFDLENSNDVKVKFSNADMKTIGSKTYQIK